MQPEFLGYLAKKTMKNPEWLRDFGVAEIASICDCFSKEAPKDYTASGWIWNASGFYSRESLALAAVSLEEAADYRLFACRIYPWIFDEDGVRDFSLRSCCPDLPPEADPALAGYDFLGFDVAEGLTQERAFTVSCSPLTCNSAADSFPANRWGLLDSLESAREAAMAFASGTIPVEPPPYFIFEIWVKDPPKI